MDHCQRCLILCGWDPTWRDQSRVTWRDQSRVMSASRDLESAEMSLRAARHYRKLRRTAEDARARTTVPWPSRLVGTLTGLAVGTFMRERTAETGVPGPR